MNHIGVLKPEALVKVLNFSGLPILAIYLFSMFIFPWVKGSGSWEYVHAVWYKWQALNVGMLAFLSSVIAFNVSRFNSYKQRQRNFIASRAFLPHALSELTSYFKSCSLLLKEAYPKVKGRSYKAPLTCKKIELPIEYKEIFSRCISFADADVGEYLTNILTRLQVNHSRLKEFENEFGENTTEYLSENDITTYMFRLGELQALVNNLFQFARGEENFEHRKCKYSKAGT